MQLVIDQFEGNRNARRIIELPTLHDVQQSILSLDGKRLSSLCISSDTGDSLVLGGGDPAVHVCLMTADASYVLTSSASPSHTVSLNIGNQLTPLPDNYLVTAERAAIAADDFLHSRLKLTEEWLFV